MSNRTILLVDDDPMWLRLVTERVRRDMPDWAMLTVESLDEAMQALQAHPTIDLVLLDLNLQQTAGLLTLQRFFALTEDATRRPKRAVVVLTGMGQEYEQAILALGAVGFSGKDALVKNPPAFWAFTTACLDAQRQASGEECVADGGCSP